MSTLDNLDNVDDVIQHFGRKGMKWGVRNESKSGGDAPPGAQGVTVKVAAGKGIRSVSGGGRHPAHEDAIRLAGIKQIAKSSSIHALSNKELQEAVKRMKLETQWHTNNPPRGAKVWVRKLLGSDVARKEVLSLVLDNKAGPKLAMVDQVLRATTGTGKHATGVPKKSKGIGAPPGKHRK